MHSSAYDESASFRSHGVIVVEELDVSGPLLIASHKVLIAGRPLIFVIARQHALDAHAYARNALDGTPTLLTQKIETDDAVGVYVRMHRNGPIGLLVKSDLRGLYTVLLVFDPCTSSARIWRNSSTDLWDTSWGNET